MGRMLQGKAEKESGFQLLLGGAVLFINLAWRMMRLREALLKKDVGVLVDGKMGMSNGHLQPRRPMAAWAAFKEA